MRTLRDAWDWYETARANLRRMRRLGTHHWNDKSLEGASIWNDDRFKRLEAITIISDSDVALAPMEDLGILVLFAVFEAAVRDHLERIVRPLASNLEHPILRNAAEEALDGIRQGSFATKVLAPLQDQKRITAELSDKVKQVRKGL